VTTRNAPQDLPQICHKEFQHEKDNGGFLRITADWQFVAKTAISADLFPEYSAKSLILWRTR